MLEKGFRRFLVDLGPCQGIDSTFMGVLIGIYQFARQTSDGERVSVAVVNANPHNRKTMSDLGLTKIIQVLDTPVSLPPGVSTERLVEERFEPDARIQLIKRAHENLIDLDEKNRAVFGPFLEKLTRELESKK